MSRIKLSAKIRETNIPAKILKPTHLNLCVASSIDSDKIRGVEIFFEQVIRDDKMSLKDPKETALQLFSDTYEANQKQYLSILASPDFDDVRKLYMQLFQWSTSILDSLRSLTNKLFFKGESQHIDTVLQSFADSFVQHLGDPSPSKPGANAVYLISYSLILLNTDLHSSDGSRKKITRADYVKNSLHALESNKALYSEKSKIELELSNYYTELLTNELKLAGLKKKPLPATTDSETLPASPNPNAGAFGFASLLLNDRALNKLHSKDSLSSNQASSSQSTVYSMKTGISMSQLSNLNEIDNESDSDNDVTSLQIVEEEGDLELELDGPPWIKEGILNVVMIDTEQEQPRQSRFSFLKSSKPTNALSKWVNGFVVVSKGELRIFSFEQSSSSVQQQGLKTKRSIMGIGRLKQADISVSSNEPVGAGNWYDHALCLGQFSLCQTYASKPTDLTLSALKSIRSDPIKNLGDVYCSLTLPLSNSHSKKHPKLVFQCGSDEIAKEFIETCNFWAARSSIVPSEDDSISSYEYGWSTEFMKLIEEFNKDPKNTTAIGALNSYKVVEWFPLLSSTLPTETLMTDQLHRTQIYYKSLKLQLLKHELLKQNFEALSKQAVKTRSQPQPSQSSFLRRRQEPVPTRSGLSVNLRMIMANYNKKLNYLNRELLKYKKYVNILTKAIKLRNEKLELELVKSSETEESIQLKNPRNDLYDDELFSSSRIIKVGSERADNDEEL